MSSASGHIKQFFNNLHALLQDGPVSHDDAQLSALIGSSVLLQTIVQHTGLHNFIQSSSQVRYSEGFYMLKRSLKRKNTSIRSVSYSSSSVLKAVTSEEKSNEGPVISNKESSSKIDSVSLGATRRNSAVDVASTSDAVCENYGHASSPNGFVMKLPAFGANAELAQGFSPLAWDVRPSLVTSSKESAAENNGKNYPQMTGDLHVNVKLPARSTSGNSISGPYHSNSPLQNSESLKISSLSKRKVLLPTVEPDVHRARVVDHNNDGLSLSDAVKSSPGVKTNLLGKRESARASKIIETAVYPPVDETVYFDLVDSSVFDGSLPSDDSKDLSSRSNCFASIDASASDLESQSLSTSQPLISCNVELSNQNELDDSQEPSLPSVRKPSKCNLSLSSIVCYRRSNPFDGLSSLMKDSEADDLELARSNNSDFHSNEVLREASDMNSDATTFNIKPHMEHEEHSRDSDASRLDELKAELRLVIAQNKERRTNIVVGRPQAVSTPLVPSNTPVVYDRSHQDVFTFPSLTESDFNQAAILDEDNEASEFTYLSPCPNMLTEPAGNTKIVPEDPLNDKHVSSGADSVELPCAAPNSPGGCGDTNPELCYPVLSVCPPTPQSEEPCLHDHAPEPFIAQGGIDANEKLAAVIDEDLSGAITNQGLQNNQETTEIIQRHSELPQISTTEVHGKLYPTPKLSSSTCNFLPDDHRSLDEHMTFPRRFTTFPRMPHRANILEKANSALHRFHTPNLLDGYVFIGGSELNESPELMSKASNDSVVDSSISTANSDLNYRHETSLAKSYKEEENSSISISILERRDRPEASYTEITECFSVQDQTRDSSLRCRSSSSTTAQAGSETSADTMVPAVNTDNDSKIDESGCSEKFNYSNVDPVVALARCSQSSSSCEVDKPQKLVSACISQPAINVAREPNSIAVKATKEEGEPFQIIADSTSAGRNMPTHLGACESEVMEAWPHNKMKSSLKKPLELLTAEQGKELPVGFGDAARDAGLASFHFMQDHRSEPPMISASPRPSPGYPYALEPIPEMPDDEQSSHATRIVATEHFQETCHSLVHCRHLRDENSSLKSENSRLRELVMDLKTRPIVTDDQLAQISRFKNDLASYIAAVTEENFYLKMSNDGFRRESKQAMNMLRVVLEDCVSLKLALSQIKYAQLSAAPCLEQGTERLALAENLSSDSAHPENETLEDRVASFPYGIDSVKNKLAEKDPKSANVDAKGFENGHDCVLQHELSSSQDPAASHENSSNEIDLFTAVSMKCLLQKYSANRVAMDELRDQVWHVLMAISRSPELFNEELFGQKFLHLWETRSLHFLLDRSKTLAQSYASADFKTEILAKTMVFPGRDRWESNIFYVMPKSLSIRHGVSRSVASAISPLIGCLGGPSSGKMFRTRRTQTDQASSTENKLVQTDVTSVNVCSADTRNISLEIPLRRTSVEGTSCDVSNTENACAIVDDIRCSAGMGASVDSQGKPHEAASFVHGDVQCQDRVVTGVDLPLAHSPEDHSVEASILKSGEDLQKAGVLESNDQTDGFSSRKNVQGVEVPGLYIDATGVPSVSDAAFETSPVKRTNCDEQESIPLESAPLKLIPALSLCTKSELSCYQQACLAQLVQRSSRALQPEPRAGYGEAQDSFNAEVVSVQPSNIPATENNHSQAADLVRQSDGSKFVGLCTNLRELSVPQKATTHSEEEASLFAFSSPEEEVSGMRGFSSRYTGSREKVPFNLWRHGVRRARTRSLPTACSSEVRAMAEVDSDRSQKGDFLASSSCNLVNHQFMDADSRPATPYPVSSRSLLQTRSSSNHLPSLLPDGPKISVLPEEENAYSPTAWNSSPSSVRKLSGGAEALRTVGAYSPVGVVTDSARAKQTVKIFPAEVPAFIPPLSSLNYEPIASATINTSGVVGSEGDTVASSNGPSYLTKEKSFFSKPSHVLIEALAPMHPSGSRDAGDEDLPFPTPDDAAAAAAAMSGRAERHRTTSLDAVSPGPSSPIVGGEFSLPAGVRRGAAFSSRIVDVNELKYYLLQHFPCVDRARLESLLKAVREDCAGGSILGKTFAEIAALFREKLCHSKVSAPLEADRE
ncbi:uncharacterized protein LOC108681806 isoform X2 [Hyalella azteca]|uniref:Uncharacterized protein LOC108681806 isoform X2 n=1 Tax=Hyalella azteca TaxID=294128 RepID=A0A979FRF3_HYAAZ|nr:uncharacterized protein LOC108681806 isoform X2 [Hyalella azteca]